MSLTPAQVRAAMVPLVRRLVNGGTPVVDFAGIGPDLGQFVIRTPVGTIPVEMPITLAALVPLTPFVADAQARIRVVLAPFESELQGGFLRRARSLQPGEPGMSPADGWG